MTVNRMIRLRVALEANMFDGLMVRSFFKVFSPLLDMARSLHPSRIRLSFFF